MRIERWSEGRSWLCGVVVNAVLLVPSLSGAWVAEAPGLAPSPVADSVQLAAIPAPPEPPQPLTPADPDEPRPAPSLEATPDSAPTAAEATALVFDDPIFDDPRAEPIVTLTPGIPVPRYPMVINPPVEALIDFFVARDRDRFGMWLARSGRYLGMIQRVFREYGLPQELAYTAMIESGFSPRAVSRVGAKGMWQFMEATARRYGLLVNRWVDERLDPVKSTIAAAKYLGDLYGMFGHWFLAQAAYNAGEARVGQAIRRAGTSDFWALTQTRHLPDETKLFVPQILAAAVITREPARYGFDVAKEAPLAYDEVTIRRPMDFDTVAELAGVPADAVRDLNPALVARITPPFGSYTLRLPVGAGSRFEASLRTTPPSRLTTWGVYRIARSDSLAQIARLYRVTPQRLAEVNHLPGGRLRGVSELIVPVSNRTAPPPVATAAAASEAAKPAGNTPARSGAGASREVLVRRGDTLWAIASRYGLSPHVLARLNGMEVDDPLHAGTRLRLSH